MESHEKLMDPLPPGAAKPVSGRPVAPSSESWEERYRRAQAELDQERLKNRGLEKEIHRLNDVIEELMKPQQPSWVKPNLSLQPHRKRRKKLGPKPGHRPAKRTVPPEDQIDRHVALAAKHCSHCQTELPLPSSWHTHTQIELPPIEKLVITRFYVGYSYCKGCHTMVGLSADQRQGMLAYSKYGPRLHAQIAYWKFGLGLTLGKIQKQLWDRYALHVSTGQLSEMLAKTAKSEEPLYQDLRQTLRGQHHLYVDETGWRESGDNFWLWSFSNEEFSYYRIEKSRGRKIVRNTLGRIYNGTLITDFYSAYNEIKCKGGKQKCWPHLLREVHELKETNPQDVELKSFSKRLKHCFRSASRAATRYRLGKDVEHACAILEGKTDELIKKTYQNADLNRLCKRLKRHRDELYTFIKSGVDPGNNQAEREIRPTVLMRKTSYCNRSHRGAHTQEVLMSIIRTCSKQEINYLDLATQSLLAS